MTRVRSRFISMKKVLVFGVFDGVHDGHRALFKQAKKHGHHLIAAIAQDHIVERLKGHLPHYDLADRIDALSKEADIDEVVLGDAEMGTYEVVLRARPHVIALGYDQEALRQDLEESMHRFDWEPRIVVLKPHEGDALHSSFLHKKK